MKETPPSQTLSTPPTPTQKPEGKTPPAAKPTPKPASKPAPKLDPAAIGLNDPAGKGLSAALQKRRESARNRFRSIVRSALVCVLLPTFLAGIYLYVFSNDQYASVAVYTIRSQSAQRTDQISLLGMGGGISSGILGDTHILEEYIASRQILADLKPNIDVRQLYSSPASDWWARYNASLTEEEFLDFWRKMVTTRTDTSTGLTTLQVRAFTAEDSAELARQILSLSEALVNRLSDRSRSDALAVASKEVDSAYQRVLTSYDALQQFSEKAKQIDPTAFAKVRSEIQARLDNELVTAQSELNLLRKDLPDDAPGIRALKSKIAVIQAQLERERSYSTFSTQDGESASELLRDFDKLRIERDFSEKAYMSTLTSLENARAEAARQSRYLEAFVRPLAPEYPEYPRRIRGIILTLLGSILLWMIAGLLISATKEHIS